MHIYLQKYNDSVYYKIVCKRILTLGFEIPNYIINSFKVLLISFIDNLLFIHKYLVVYVFKKVNSSALLQIFINFGLLEEACDLCFDYIDALLTNFGIERFDIKVRKEYGFIISGVF